MAAHREKIWGRPKPVLTCPFCGKDETVLLTLAGRDDGSRHYAVLCRSCRARGPVKETPAEANECWREREPAK